MKWEVLKLPFFMLKWSLFLVGVALFLPKSSATKLFFFGKHPQKFNMEPENDGLQKESPFLGADFQVPC